MRILILSPNQINRYNWGHQLFRNEIGRQHDVIFYGEGFPQYNKKWSLKKIIDIKYRNLKPDLIMTYGWRYSKDFIGLDEIVIPKAHIVVDYIRPDTLKKQNIMHRRNKYDLLFAITTGAYDLLKKNTPDIPVGLIPFSVDTNIYKKDSSIKKENMVLASFNSRTDVYPNRVKIKTALATIGVKIFQKKVNHKQLINMINRCKITVTANNIWGSLSMRYTETLASGGFLLADKPVDLEVIGLQDKKHLIIYDGIEDFKEKVKYYLKAKHDSEREMIEREGMEFVRKNHSCEVRVKEMTDFITKKTGIK